MEVHEGCSVDGESNIGRGRGGCIGKFTSGSHCQGLPTDGGVLCASFLRGSFPRPLYSRSQDPRIKGREWILNNGEVPSNAFSLV